MIFIGLEFVGVLRESADLRKQNFTSAQMVINRCFSWWTTAHFLDAKRNFAADRQRPPPTTSQPWFFTTGCLWHGSSRNIGMNKRNNAMADMYLNTIRKYYMSNVSGGRGIIEHSKRLNAQTWHPPRSSAKRECTCPLLRGTLPPSKLSQPWFLPNGMPLAWFVPKHRDDQT